MYAIRSYYVSIINKENAANKIENPKSDNLSVFGAPIRSVKYPPTKLPNKALV